MKKLLLITPMLNQGGLERVCALTGQLMKPYFDVSIAVFDSVDIIYDISGINLIDLKLPSRKGRIGKLCNVFIRTWKLKEIKEKQNIQIAYSFGPSANLPNVLSRKKKTKTWIGLRSYLDLANKEKLKFVCKRADRILCCSGEIETEIQKYLKVSNTITVRNPFDIDYIKRLSREKATLPWGDEFNIIVSMGRENDVKGFWHLIKSFKILNENMENTRLLIIGAGEYTEYKKLAEKFGIEDKVFFTGVKSNPYPYLKRAKLYVLSSLNEGFPNALVEAMALSLPVIATDCMTGPAEIINDEKKSLNTKSILYGKYGILIPRMNEKKNMNNDVIEEEERILADVMEQLFADHEMYHLYCQRAEQRARFFSYENYQNTLLSID